MTDVLGWRKKFGVLGPSTNSVVQPEFDDMRPSGVTNHHSRIFTVNAQAVGNETFMAGTQVISDDADALGQVGTNLPMAKLAAEMAQRLGKPVIAINTAPYWHALRSNGIPVQSEGFGSPLEERQPE